MTLSGSGEASREGSSAKTADASKSLVFAAPPSCPAAASAAGLTSTSTADVVNVCPGFGFCAFEDEEAALDGGAGVGTSGSTSASRNAGAGVATSGSPALCSGACFCWGVRDGMRFDGNVLGVSFADRRLLGFSIECQWINVCQG